MAKLQIVFKKGGRKGDVLTFTQDLIRIGRHEDNDVVLHAKRDRKASSHHANIIRDGDRFLIQDLDSTNGTFVGGARIDDDFALSNGETVMFGPSGPLIQIRIIGAAHDPQDPTANIDMVPDAPKDSLDSHHSIQPKDEAETGLDDLESDISKIETRRLFRKKPEPETKESTTAPNGQDKNLAEASYPSGRTAHYKAMMLDTVNNARRPLIAMIIVLAVLLIMTGVGAFLYMQKESKDYKAKHQDDQERLVALEKKHKLMDRRLKAIRIASRDTQDELAEETLRLIELKERLKTAHGTTRRDLENKSKVLEKTQLQLVKRLEENQKELARLTKSSSAAERIASRFDKALFMLVAKTPKEQGFCTAFAVHHTGLLATNAHCVKFADKLKSEGLKTYARMNKAPEFTYKVKSWRIHPDYNDTVFSADVALIQLELQGIELPITVQLATNEELIQLRPGRAIYTMGYPGKVMNPNRPDASLRTSVISRFTTYEKVPSDPKFTQMLWHSALTSKGTSGSPIFDSDGIVIAVNNGGLSARRILNESKVGKKNVEVAYDATGLNFGIRVDTLRELLPAYAQ